MKKKKTKDIYTREQFDKLIESEDLTVNKQQKVTDESGNHFVADFVDSDGNIYEIKKIDFMGMKQEIVFKLDPEDSTRETKHFKNFLGRAKLYDEAYKEEKNVFTQLINDENVNQLLRFLNKKTLNNQKILSQESELSPKFIREINNEWHFAPFSYNKRKETSINKITKTAFDGPPKDFFTPSYLNLFSELFYDNDSKIGSTVIFNIAHRDKMQHLYDPQMKDHEWWRVSLIFDKNLGDKHPTTTPTFIREPYLGAVPDSPKKKKYKIYSDEFEHLNESNHIHIKNFYDGIWSGWGIELHLHNHSKYLPTKSDRLNFLRRYICNLSQNEFSATINDLGATATSTTINRWENDKSDNPLWYRKHFPLIIDCLANSENYFGILAQHYDWFISVDVNEVFEDFIIYDDYKSYRHVPDPIFQMLVNYNQKESKTPNEFNKRFNKLYKETKATLEHQDDLELNAKKVQDIFKYFIVVSEEILFDNMKSYSFSEEKMKKIYRIWWDLKSKY